MDLPQRSNSLNPGLQADLSVERPLQAPAKTAVCGDRVGDGGVTGVVAPYPRTE